MRRWWSGFALGLFRLAVDTPVTLGVAGFENGYAEGSFLWIVNNIYFQYYSVLIFLVCAAVMVAGEPHDRGALGGADQGPDLPDHDRRSTAASRATSWGNTEVVWSGVVLVLILIAYLYFTG